MNTVSFAAVFFFSIFLGSYLTQKSNSAEKKGSKVESTLLLDAFFVLIAAAIYACMEPKSASDIVRVKYAVVDNAGFGLIVGFVLTTVLVRITSPRKKGPFR